MTGSPTTYCIAVDPGKTTGIAILMKDGDGLRAHYTWETDFTETVNTLDTALTDLPAFTDVVIEKFTITPKTAQNSQAPWSLEVIGAVRALLVMHGRLAEDLIFQTPAAAKNFCTNQNLKDMGLWHKGGAGHAQDALRHGVLYYASRGFTPPSLIASKVTDS
jgi:hypothetical protein